MSVFCPFLCSFMIIVSPVPGPLFTQNSPHTPPIRQKGKTLDTEPPQKGEKTDKWFKIGGLTIKTSNSKKQKNNRWYLSFFLCLLLFSSLLSPLVYLTHLISHLFPLSHLRRGPVAVNDNDKKINQKKWGNYNNSKMLLIMYQSCRSLP